MINVGGHLSCDFFSFYSEAMFLYDAKQAACRSHFEKLNFDALSELVRREGIDCEYKYNGGGWNVYLTEEDFAQGKRELEGMKAAGGYVSSLKIFEGKEAAKVHYRCGRMLTVRPLVLNTAPEQYIPVNECQLNLMDL